MGGIFLERARQLHEEYPVVDAHLDLASEVYLRRTNGETGVVEHLYLPHWRQAGLNLVVSSIYVSNAELEAGKGLHHAVAQIGALREDLEPLVSQVQVVTSRRELETALEAGKIAIMLSLEGLDPLDGDLYLLRSFYDLGVRGAGLTWSRPNAFATGCCKASELLEIPGGLTPLGKKGIEKLEDLGMFVDVSHLNNDGFEELLQCAKNPFIASHSNAWEVQENYRNLRDDQIQELVKRGGVIGLNANCRIAGASPLPEHREEALEKLCAHIEYLVEQAGADHIGYGFDLCNGLNYARNPDAKPEELGDLLDNHSDMLKLTAKLLERGMSEEAVIRIIGTNFLEFYKNVLK